MIPQTGIIKSELNFSWTIPQVKLKYVGERGAQVNLW